MAAGRRIDDHASWVGKGSNGTVFPIGAKIKSESDDGHDGHLSDYEDTTESIKAQQELGVKTAKGHPQRPLHRY